MKFILILLFPVYCCAQTNPGRYLIDEDGIAVEKPDSTKFYDEVYNDNNLIYKIDKKFTYSYYHQTATGEKFLIKKGKDLLQPQGYTISDWAFVCGHGASG